MKINTQHRTLAPEIMDDFNLEGQVLQDALDKIASINRWLGGNQLTLNSVKLLLQQTNHTKSLKIIDVGCGNGDMLRALADFGSKNQLDMQLIGIDANAFTIDYARTCSQEYPNIEFLCMDIFSEEFKQYSCDILLCTLTLHHFTNQEISKLLPIFYQNTKIGVVVNDLHRHLLAYRLFQVLCKVFNLNDMSREDGLTSILRGFKKQELLDFTQKLNPKSFVLSWKWAFRYQWILKKV
jgi:SAM-dependent methyltransferase